MPHYHCPACGSTFHSESQELLERCECGHSLDFWWMPPRAAGPDRHPGTATGSAKRRFRRGRRSTTAA